MVFNVALPRKKLEEDGDQGMTPLDVSALQPQYAVEGLSAFSKDF